ncbi:unnamed protein product, partial [Polarella glacialis]
AKKTAALERARALARAAADGSSERPDNESVAANPGPGPVSGQGSDFQAKKATALDRARALARAAADGSSERPDSGSVGANPGPGPASGQGSDLQDTKARSEDGQDRARRAFEEEKARKKSALERARAKALVAANGSPDRPASDTLGSNPRLGGDLQDAKARSEAGQDRARLAFEEEKARKTMALERAKAKALAAANGSSDPPASDSLGSSPGLSLGRGQGSDCQDAQARSDDGQDRARRAFEEEKARKAMALERARAKARAAGDGSSDRPASDSLGSNPKVVGAREAVSGGALHDAKAKSEAGHDRARRAFEEEKARKASALERARARARAAASGSDGLGLGPNPGLGLGRGRGRGLGFGGFGSWQQGLGGGRGFGGAPQDLGLSPGILVRLDGLKARPELNGCVGTLISLDKAKGRWQVRLEDCREDMLFKEDNLHAVSVDEYEAAQAQAARMDAHLADKLRCPNEHGMVVEIADEVYECDVCEADIDVHTKLLYCQRCDHAICETCSVEMLRKEAMKINK